jgi:hypothetical protein
MMPIRVMFASESLSSEQAAPRYARFLAEVSRHLEHTVPLVQMPLRDIAPSDSFIILETPDLGLSLATCEQEQRIELARRLIPVYPPRGRGAFHAQMEQFSVAAAIEASAIASWEHADPADRNAGGLTGKRDLALHIDASCMDDLAMPPVGYCFLVSTKHYGIPHLLADYLRCLRLQQIEAGN